MNMPLSSFLGLPAWVGGVVLAVSPAILSAQRIRESAPFDSSVVTRKGADIEGALNARSVVALDRAASVVIADGARVVGDLIVAAEAKKQAIGLPDGKPLTPSSRTKIDNRSGGSGLGGSVRAVEPFDLPVVYRPMKPVSSNSVQIQGAESTPADLSKVGSLTLRKPGATVSLPAGAYGDLAIDQGTIVLGSAGTDEPARYEFRSLEVQARGKLDVAGPVVITVASGTTYRGDVGSAAAPLWLDLRVAQGDITLAGSANFSGILTAPASTVTVARGAVFAGGIVSDRLTVQNGATVTAAEPNWTSGAPAKTRPRFPHKALRLQAKLPALRDSFKYSYFPGANYIEDVPYVMLAEGKRPRDHPRAGYEEQLSLFAACCTLFMDTGFDRAGLILPAYSDDPVHQPPLVRNVMLTRGQFEAQVREAGGADELTDNIKAIERSPTRLNTFVQGILALALPPG